MAMQPGIEQDEEEEDNHGRSVKTGKIGTRPHAKDGLQVDGDVVGGRLASGPVLFRHAGDYRKAVLACQRFASHDSLDARRPHGSKYEHRVDAVGEECPDRHGALSHLAKEAVPRPQGAPEEAQTRSWTG